MTHNSFFYRWQLHVIPKERFETFIIVFWDFELLILEIHQFKTLNTSSRKFSIFNSNKHYTIYKSIISKITFFARSIIRFWIFEKLFREYKNFFMASFNHSLPL